MRLFTALCFDEETKKALFSAGKEAEKHSSGNFTLYDNLHLTLVFIGETERENEIKTALDDIKFPSFDYEVSGCGTFEKGIFWAGIRKNEKLSALQKEVFEKLKNLGFELDEREYVPHITLARKFKPSGDFCFEDTESLLPKNPVSAGCISLMKSERIDGVLCYSEIYSVKLF